MLAVFPGKEPAPSCYTGPLFPSACHSDSFAWRQTATLADITICRTWGSQHLSSECGSWLPVFKEVL